MKLRVLIAATAFAAAVAGCSSSAKSAAGGAGAPAAGQPTSAPLGQALTSGQMKVAVSGPAAVKAGDEFGYATFQVSLTNIGTAGDAAGPTGFEMDCGGKTYAWVSTSTAGGKSVPAGQTVAATVVLEWAHTTDREDTKPYDPSIKDKPLDCPGTAVIKAYFDQSADAGMSWTVPADQTAQINTAAKAG